MTRPKLYALLCLLLLTVFMRVEVTRLTEIDNPFRADARHYVLYAYNLVEFGIYSRDDSGIAGKGQPSADGLRPAGYPVFMAPFVSVLGLDDALPSIKWAQTLMSIAVVGLTFILALECLTWWLAFIVATLTAISPHLININVYWLTESLFTFLLVLSLVFLARLARDRQNIAMAVLFGITIGYCTFTRQTTSLFILPVLLLLYFHQRVGFGRTAGIVLLSMLAIPLLWSMSYAPDGSEAGTSLLHTSIRHGMYPGFQYKDVAESYGFPYRFDPRTPELSASWGALGEELWHRFATEPARHIYWFLIGKPLAFLSWDIVQGQGGGFIYPVLQSPYYSLPFLTYSHVLSGWLHFPLMLLSLLGSLLVWIATWRRWLPAGSLFVPQLLSLLLLYFIAIHMVFVPFPRYAVPLRPVSYLMAIWCCWAVWQLVQRARSIRGRVLQ